MKNSEMLRHTIQHLKDNWYEKNTGIVAATLYDEGLIMSATSRFLPQHNRWQHAESVAIEEFTQKYGKPSPVSEMIVTLSPCMSTTSSKRYGASCSHQIVNSGIAKVKFGWLDTHENQSVDEYKPLGLMAEMIEEPDLARICGNLYGLFGQLYGPDGQYAYLAGTVNPWQRIKEIVGLSIFQ
jgi:tRNA(Arg) A34 adenosine deaminase TadA